MRIVIGIMFCFLVSSCSSRSPSDVVARCAEEFKVPELNSFKFEVLLSEDGVLTKPKYHLRLKQGNFQDLKTLLERSGYKDWKRGELSFEGTSFGWEEEDLEYSQIKRTGATYYVALSQKANSVIFVRYP